MTERKIYFFGDSIAFGQGVSICDTLFKMYKTRKINLIVSSDISKNV